MNKRQWLKEFWDEQDRRCNFGKVLRKFSVESEKKLVDELYKQNLSPSFAVDITQQILREVFQEYWSNINKKEVQ